MRPLSASEAISPAIERTKAVLFQPFRLGRSWKLAAIAYFSIFGLYFVPTPLAILFFPSRGGVQGLISHFFMLGIAILSTAILFLFFYLGSRLQFVLFALVLEKAKMIAPLWNRYDGARNWRWIGLKLILNLVACVVFAVPVFYFFRSLIANMSVQSGQSPSPQMFENILLLYIFIFVPLFILMLLSSLLSDFVLPPIALEDATLSDALGRFFQLVKTEPLPMLAFILFKILLAIAGMVAMEIVIIVAEIVGAIPLGLLALLGWYLLRSAGPVGHVLMIAGAITLALILFAFIFYVAILVLGCLHTFFQAYALYFLGGRYLLLGNLLEPGAPDYVAASAPPEFPPLPALPSEGSSTPQF
jgi:hypothetical protein